MNKELTRRCLIERLENIISDYVELELSKTDNNGWIPVSERLPDAYQLVLATYEDKRIEIAFIHLGGVWSGYFWGEVIAWQPLPGPYKGEANEI